MNRTSAVAVRVLPALLQEWLHDGGGLGAAEGPEEDIADDPISIEEDVGRQTEPLVGAIDRAGGVETDGVGQLIRLCVGSDIIDGRLLHAYRDHLEAFRCVSSVGISKDGRLLLARWTPRGKEVEPHRAASSIRQAHDLTIKVEEGSRLTLDLALEFGRTLTYVEPRGRLAQLEEAGTGRRDDRSCRCADGRRQERQQQRSHQHDRADDGEVPQSEGPDDSASPARRPGRRWISQTLGQRK